MARNRKRAKERRARRPQPVATARTEREDPRAPLADAGTFERDEEQDDRDAFARPGDEDETPGPMTHATPDVELAEAQLAIGRPELVDAEDEVSEEEDVELEEEEDEEDDLEPVAAASGGDGGAELAVAARVPVEHRVGTGGRLINFLQGSWRELQRVQWPDRRAVMQATGVVIGFVIVAGVFLGVADFLAGKLVDFILK